MRCEVLWDNISNEEQKLWLSHYECTRNLGREIVVALTNKACSGDLTVNAQSCNPLSRNKERPAMYFTFAIQGQMQFTCYQS